MEIPERDPNPEEPPLPPKLEKVIRGVKRPIVGFSDLTHPDGRPFTINEQIEATKKQLRGMAREFLENGDPIDDLAVRFGRMRVMKPIDEETTP